MYPNKGRVERVVFLGFMVGLLLPMLSRAYPGSGRFPAPLFPSGVETHGPNKFRGAKQLETVAVLVDFPDNPADIVHFSPARFDSMLYSKGIYNGQQYRQGSLTDFFLENSYGQFDVIGSIAGGCWFRSIYNYSRYDDGYYMLTTGYQLASENMAQVDQVVDFSNYDLDGNDTIDAMFMVHAGADGADDGNTTHCWSHAISYFGYHTNDGVVIAGVTNVPEFAMVTEARETTICCIAVMCHELGHLAGLPDLYDYSRYTWGVGYWGLMGYGAWGAGGNTPWSPAHMEAWSKIEAGFVIPTVITSDTHDLKIVNVETNPVVYKVWRDGKNVDTCFLLENRQNRGFDTPLPNAGLLIWHIDPGQPGYDDIVDLEEDSTFHLDLGTGVRPDPHEYHPELGTSSDPFPGSWGRGQFSDITVPSSRDNEDLSTGIAVMNIRSVEDTIICDILLNSLGVSTGPTTGPCFSSPKLAVFPSPFRNRTTISLGPSAAKNVSTAVLSIYNCIGQRILFREIAPFTSFVWDGTGEDKRCLPSGIYLFRLETAGEGLLQRALLVR
jgi:immune inhibitor A